MLQKAFAVAEARTGAVSLAEMINRLTLSAIDPLVNFAYS
jgi:hypothetical protein